MPFFIKNRKRKPENSQFKKQNSRHSQKADEKRSKKKKRFLGEEVESDSDNPIDEDPRNKVYSSEEEEVETAQEKKLRLAKQYLSQIQSEEAEKLEEDDIHKDIISHRLKQDILEQTGRLHKQVADEYIPPTVDDITVLRGHQLSVTCITISPDSRHVYSASKDCSIVKCKS